KSEVRADGGDFPPDGGRAEAEVLEQIDEITQQSAGHLAGIAHPFRRRELRQAVEIAEVRLDGVRAVTRLEREKVAETLEPEVLRGPLAGLGDRHGLRWARSRRDTSARSPGAMASSSAATCIIRASCAPIAPSANATVHIRSTSSSRSLRATRVRSRRA